MALIIITVGAALFDQDGDGLLFQWETWNVGSRSRGALLSITPSSIPGC